MLCCCVLRYKSDKYGRKYNRYSKSDKYDSYDKSDKYDSYKVGVPCRQWGSCQL